MNPLQTLFRQIILIVVGIVLGRLVRWGFLSVENADALTPTMQLIVDFYLPLAFPIIIAAAHQIYLKFIGSRLFEVARNSPAGVTEKEINDEALGEGGKRKAARLLAGIK